LATLAAALATTLVRFSLTRVSLIGATLTGVALPGFTLTGVALAGFTRIALSWTALSRIVLARIALSGISGCSQIISHFVSFRHRGLARANREPNFVVCASFRFALDHSPCGGTDRTLGR